VEEKVESERWIIYFDNAVNVSWNGVSVVIIFLSIKTIRNKDKETGCLWRFNANHFLSEMRMID